MFIAWSTRIRAINRRFVLPGTSRDPMCDHLAVDARVTDPRVPEHVNRISTRFALMMAAAAVVPLLAYGAVSIVSVRGGARQAVIHGNQDVARRVGEQIRAVRQNNVRILNAVAADMQQTDLAPWQQKSILKNFVRDFDEFRELTLLDDDGRVVASSRLDTVAGDNCPVLET